MKIIAVLFFLMLIVPASAQTETPQAGITPDSFLWGIEIALEKIAETAMFDSEKKIELQLKHADERIAEAQAAKDPAKALTQYTNLISRISTDEIEYTSAEMIRSRIKTHETILTTMQDTPTEETIKQGRMLAITAEHNQDQAQDGELQWWKTFTSQQQVTPVETSILSKYNLEMKDIHKYTPAGVTKVTIKERNGDTITTYTISHTETDITIKEGETEAYDNEYTFEIRDIKRYTEKYGAVIGYGS